MSATKSKKSDYRPRRSLSFHQKLPSQENIANPNRPSWLKLTPTEIPLVFFDLETTGGNPDNSEIIEIGAIKYVGEEEVSRFETLVKCRSHIPSIVRKITGIDNKTLEKAPYIEEIFEEFIKFLGNGILVAHGAQSDVPYIQHYYRKMFNAEFTNYFFCTHLLTSNFLPNVPSKTLAGVSEYFGLDVKNAHCAIDDAIMAKNIFWKIYSACEKKGFKTCEDLLKIQGDQETVRKLGPGINPAALYSVPTSPGILFVLGSGEEISYMTASSNLKNSLSKLLELSFENKELNKVIVDACGFKFERSPHFLDALLREKKELKRISIPLDPRKVQKRSEKFLQIFVPEDMIEFARTTATTLPIVIPTVLESHDYSEEKNDYISTDETIYTEDINERDTNSSVDVTQTRKNFGHLKTARYKLDRKLGNTEIVRFGHLTEGLGYCFGPFESADKIMPLVNTLLKEFPFADSSIPTLDRFHYLQTLVYLLSNEKEKIQDKYSHSFNLNSLLNPKDFLINFSMLNKIQKLNSDLFDVKKDFCQILQSGLCIISNNEFKEFEVYAVVKGKIIKKMRLPYEGSDKFKSPRFFTRLFENNYLELKNIKDPTYFDDDRCSEIELTSYWTDNKRGEGEWIRFEELESLFDLDVL